jgi:hypothetical protein
MSSMDGSSSKGKSKPNGIEEEDWDEDEKMMMKFLKVRLVLSYYCHLAGYQLPSSSLQQCCTVASINMLILM